MMTLRGAGRGRHQTRCGPILFPSYVIYPRVEVAVTKGHAHECYMDEDVVTVKTSIGKSISILCSYLS